MTKQNTLIKELCISGDSLQFHEAGFINGVKAAFVKFTGPEDWGVTVNIPRSDVESLSKNESWLEEFIEKAKLKLGLSDKPLFTKGELKVIKAIDAESSNEDIADRLCLSSYTVKTHLYFIYKKAGVRNRRELLAYIENNGILN